MKASEIYLWAAELIDDESASFYGYALDLAGQPMSGDGTAPLQKTFGKLFLGRNDAFSEREHKVIALLFMSEIARSEE